MSTSIPASARWGRQASIALAVLLFVPMAARSQGDEPWTLKPRQVPAPAAVSPELHAAIAAAPLPDAETQWGFVPQDADGWRAMQKATLRAQPLDGIAKSNGVAIEAGEIAGVEVFLVEPLSPAADHAEHLFLHVHGGGYVLGGGNGAVTEAAVAAGIAGIRAVSIDYRMPPDHPFPAAVEDVVAVYRELLKERAASSIAIGGTSAGGGLALASVHRFLALGLEPPGAIYAGTPWADLTKTGDTLFTNEGLDRVLVAYDGLLEAAAELYADGHDLRDPLISPVYGSFEGFPPTYLVTGTRDMFLSDTVRTHRKLKAAGVVADLNVYEGFSHAEYLMVPTAPEAREVFEEMGAFFGRHLSAD
ncbi:MAG: alpha/beta hydrolase fold domain-containing protein [Thermoanaerobaculia bacterium]|nr:alpha/beta hydrolase fold domain-containing protein [Thermoanaerobaculia bacterium]